MSKVGTEGEIGLVGQKGDLRRFEVWGCRKKSREVPKRRECAGGTGGQLRVKA